MPSGNDRDVGVALVKTLQNTRYSIDEKLEQSFINLFGRKPPSASDDNVDANESRYSQRHVSILDREDDDRLDDKEVSDDDEAGKKELIAESESDDSDGDNNCTMDDDHEGDQQITAFSHDLKEEIEFHNGRFRRRVISSDYKYNGDLQVNYLCCWFFFCQLVHRFRAKCDSNLTETRDWTLGTT